MPENGAKQGKSAHGGHRQRMFKRYRENGIEALEDHEILEMLLYLAVPRRNTNETAHALLDEYGTLERVFKCRYDELVGTKLVGDTAATMLPLIGDLVALLADREIKFEPLCDDDSRRRYCRMLMHGCTDENAYILYLDNAMRLVGKYKIPCSSCKEIRFDIRQVVARAVACSCSNIIITHFHTSGITAPTSSDIAATRRIATALDELNIRVVDHIIVTESTCYSMREANTLPIIF